jgi:hypothetical protein
MHPDGTGEIVATSGRNDQERGLRTGQSLDDPMYATVPTKDDGHVGHVSWFERITSKDIHAGQAKGFEYPIVFVRMKDRGNTHRSIVGDTVQMKKKKAALG